MKTVEFEDGKRRKRRFDRREFRLGGDSRLFDGAVVWEHRISGFPFFSDESGDDRSWKNFPTN